MALQQLYRLNASPRAQHEASTTIQGATIEQPILNFSTPVVGVNNILKEET